MQNECWKLIATTKTTECYVSDMGRCKTVWRSGKERISYGSLNRETGYRHFAGDNVHRHVAKSFLGMPQDRELQVDHINGNREDNRLENLRWVTRKVNNSTYIARYLKSIHHKARFHHGLVIQAAKGDDVRYFANGHEAARQLGCSHVLVYQVLNKRHYQSAKGYTLKWVSADVANR